MIIFVVIRPFWFLLYVQNPETQSLMPRKTTNHYAVVKLETCKWSKY